MNKSLETFAIHTLGCKVNLFESNSIRNDLLSHGYTEVPFSSKADIYVINTCSVTNKADSKSKMFIRNAIKNNPNGIIVVAGCMSQVNPNLMEELGIHIQIGNKYKNSIIDLINEFLNKKQKIKKIDNLFKETNFEENNSFVFLENTRAFVKIQDGCNFMCSYCIIPFARGRQRSNSKEKIISEIKDLVNKGYKEIVLTGVNTAGYNDGQNNFYDLLVAINLLNGDFRVRISSIEPFQITNEIVNLITSNQRRFCQHWHICLQSGSDEVLKKMNRKYSTNDFLKLVNQIKKLSPDSNITTDYIVGFPTEEKIDHLRSIIFLDKVKFFDMHIFPYSSRKKTVASTYKEIDATEKTKRFKEISEICLKNKRIILKKFVGKTLEVIFETKKESIPYYQGYSSQYCIVNVVSNKDLKGQKHKVKITKVLYDSLLGEIV